MNNMKNADKPINPVYDNQNNLFGDENGVTKGLTKREYFAAMAMQGLLSADAKYNGKTNDRESLSKDALAHADELLKQLEQ